LTAVWATLHTTGEHFLMGWIDVNPALAAMLNQRNKFLTLKEKPITERYFLRYIRSCNFSQKRVSQTGHEPLLLSCFGGITTLPGQFIYSLRLSVPLINKDAGSCIEVAIPSQFPKGIPGIWSPEHLFTAAVSSCLMTTFLSIAENSKLTFINFSCKSKGKLEQVEGKFMMSEIILEPTVTITDEKDRERAERVLQKSEAACLISNSVKSKITMITTIKIN